MPGGRLELASQDYESALRERARQLFLQVRVVGPIKAIDGLLGDLEEMNVAGRRRVPKSWTPRLARLQAMLPAEVREVPELRSNIAPTRLMDALFRLQDGLLDLKVGPRRHRLRAGDDLEIRDVA